MSDLRYEDDDYEGVVTTPLVACNDCGAVVPEYSMADHEKWHNKLEEDIWKAGNTSWRGDF